MRTQITSIETHPEGVKITAVVYWRRLPPPQYDKEETDEQYAERVKSIAQDLDGYNNLHIGWAELTQKPDMIKIPTVQEYES